MHSEINKEALFSMCASFGLLEDSVTDAYRTELRTRKEMEAELRTSIDVAQGRLVAMRVETIRILTDQLVHEQQAMRENLIPYVCDVDDSISRVRTEGEKLGYG